MSSPPRRTARVLFVALLAAAGCRSTPASKWPPDDLGPQRFSVRVFTGGRPLPGAKVTFGRGQGARLLLSNQKCYHETFETTDAVGVASTTLDGWSILTRVLIRAPGLARVETHAERDVLRDVHLERETLVRGHIEDEKGRRVPHAPGVCTRYGSVPVDERGEFTLHELRRGDTMEISHWERHRFVVGDERLVLRVPAGGVLHFSLFLPDRKEPPPDTWSCLLEERVGRRWLPATEHRRRLTHEALVFDWLRPGIYRAVLRVPGVGTETSREITVTGRGTGGGATLHPGPGRTVSGVVLDPEGPVPGALVRLSGDDPDASGTLTDASGRFTLEDMPLTESSVTVTEARHETTTAPVSLPGGPGLVVMLPRH